MISKPMLPGILLIFAGVALLLGRIGVLSLGFWGIVWLAVAAGGGFLVVRGMTSPAGGRGRVFWGIVLLAFGVYRFLVVSDFFYPEPGIAFTATCFALGVAFLAASTRRPPSLPLGVVGAASLVLGTAVLLAEADALAYRDVKDVITTWTPVVLILFGASLLIPRRRT
jgi:hypothetical protein